MKKKILKVMIQILIF